MGLYQGNRFHVRVRTHTGHEREEYFSEIDGLTQYLSRLLALAEQVEDDSGRPYFAELTVTDEYKED